MHDGLGMSLSWYPARTLYVSSVAFNKNDFGRQTESLPEVTCIEITVLVLVENLECLLEVCITTMAVLVPLLLDPFIPHH